MSSRTSIVAGGLVALAALAAPGIAPAQPPGVHALTGVRVVVSPGQAIDGATVVFRDGILEAVGQAVEVPPDARVWDREGLTVYAGLIEPYAARPWPEQDAEEGDAPSGLHPNHLVRPERRMVAWARDASADRKLREAGFTTALVLPADGLFRGRGALVNLSEGPLTGDVLRAELAQVAGMTTDSLGGGYPSSQMGAVALFRQTVLDAGHHRAAWRAWNRRPAQPRPRTDTALRALEAAAAGEERMILESGDALDGLRLAALAAELGLDAWIVGSGDEYRWLDRVAALGLPRLVPLDFPELPDVGDDDDLAIGLDELRHWDLAPENPKRLLDRGVVLAFTSHRLEPPKSIHLSLRRSIDAGLTAEEALAALTTTPAALLGIADRAGTVEPGKMANLVVVEGGLFVDDPKIRELWIDGVRHEVKETKPPERTP